MQIRNWKQITLYIIPFTSKVPKMQWKTTWWYMESISTKVSIYTWTISTSTRVGREDSNFYSIGDSTILFIFKIMVWGSSYIQSFLHAKARRPSEEEINTFFELHSEMQRLWTARSIGRKIVDNNTSLHVKHFKSHQWFKFKFVRHNNKIILN